MAEDIFAEEEPQMADDGLPPPAYQPQVAAFEPTPEPEAFVAPRAPAPAHHRPKRWNVCAPPPKKRTKPSLRLERHPVSAEKPRFGINSLINRMTGSNEAESGDQGAPRQQPPCSGARCCSTLHLLQSQPRAVDPDQERIEIPAFLRRQAN